jgi:hypothetical protein
LGTDTCENLFEHLVGPPPANVVGRLPESNDVSGIFTRGAVVPNLAKANGSSPLHNQRVGTVYTALSSSTSPTNFAMSIAGIPPDWDGEHPRIPTARPKLSRALSFQGACGSGCGGR